MDRWSECPWATNEAIFAVDSESGRLCTPSIVFSIVMAMNVLSVPVDEDWELLSVCIDRSREKRAS